MGKVWIRRIAITIGALLLLLVVGIGIFIATFDVNRYKSLAVDWMKTEYDRTLAIDGPIELSVWPKLAVKVSKVRLSEHGRPDEFLAVDQAALAVQVMPLLKKQVVIDQVSARGVRAAYLRDADGKRNIDDLVASSAKPGPPGPGAKAESGEQALAFDVSAVQFDDVRLRVRDTQANLAGDVALASFKSGRLANQAESPVSLRATVQLTEPQPVALNFHGSMTLKLDLAKNAVAARDLKLNVQGDAADAKSVSVALQGALAWDGKALSAGPLQVSVKQATRGALALAPSTLDVERVLYDPDAQKLELKALKIALAGRQSADDFSLALDWPQLAVDAKSLSGSALSGQFKLEGAKAISGDFRSGSPTGNFDALRLPGVAVTLKGNIDQRKVDGKVNADLALSIARKTAALENLALDMALVDPGLQPLQLAVKGKASADAKAAQWTLAGSINANRFESNGRAALGGRVPNIKADARFDSLDLNKLLLADKPVSAAAAPPPSAAAPADTPVQLDGLNGINGQFKFSAGTLTFRQYRIADAKVDASIDGGTLRIAQLAGRAWGGRIDASGSAAAASRRIGVKMVADGVDVNAMLRDVAGKDLLEGTGRVTADVVTAGATLGALRSNLGGNVALQVRDGAIKGINLAQTFRQAKAALTMKADALTKATSSEKTDFTALTATAKIANGVATSNDLDVKSPFLRIRGDGRFDIGRGTIDYTARATVTDTVRGQGGADLSALRGVTVPVALTGPFSAIDWKIQWSAVAVAAIQNQVKDKLMERLGAELGKRGGATPAVPGQEPAKPRDQILNQLKGLFN